MLDNSLSGETEARPTLILAQASWVESVPRSSLMSIDPRYWREERGEQEINIVVQRVGHHLY